jgi:cellulose synthase/poly-beta-1,6-N-acetylglucosamine synthase-like glycosyltransferase
MWRPVAYFVYFRWRSNLLLRVLYVLIALWLSLYGIQALILTFLYFWHRRNQAGANVSVPAAPAVWPHVVVQLPIYNERLVVERLIDAAAGLDYPPDCLQVQVLDDSTDETSQLAEERAAFHRARGIDVCVLRRPVREGFKAGALAWGMRQTDAELLAIFDADFSPAADFLRRTVPCMLDGRVGMVQTRWAHLNEAYSALTLAESIFIDGHFVVEQYARNQSGLLMSFNGSGGVWRRRCIEEAGGWQSDTMTEDMDLSYRAQLAGWRCVYLPHVSAPAELPPQIVAFKQQQARWAEGSAQCLRKLGPAILSSRLSGVQKLMALAHISNYLAAPLFVILVLATLPVIWLAQPMPRALTIVGLASLGPPLLLTVAQGALHRNWAQRILYMPVLILIAMGIAWNTSRGVWRGLTHWGGTFNRTPKYRLEGRQGLWRGSLYSLLPDRAIVGEIALMLYALLTVAVAWSRGSFGAMPYLLLYATGFGLVAAMGIKQRYAL